MKNHERFTVDYLTPTPGDVPPTTWVGVGTMALLVVVLLVVVSVLAVVILTWVVSS